MNKYILLKYQLLQQECYINHRSVPDLDNLHNRPYMFGNNSLEQRKWLSMSDARNRNMCYFYSIN